MAEAKVPFNVSLYNPALLKKEDLIRGFVARQPLLERFLNDLRREIPGSAPQHHLIIGQRGLGKTTLLHRIAFAIEDDPELRATWIPLVFPEEQYNVGSLADFWLNCVDALSDALDRLDDRAASQALDAKVEGVPQAGMERSRAALNILLEESARLNRRILLLVDNIDIVLDRLSNDEEWEFRRVISEERSLHFIGASSRVLEALYEHGRAFYDFFQVHELKGLDEEETLSTLLQLAEQSGNKDVARIVKEQPGRIKALRVLTGGNPRTLMLLFRVLSQGPEGDVHHDIEQLLDQHTALYKARFEELSAQAQQIVDAMAIHWDPLTAADLTEQLGSLEVNQVSAQLKRLVDFGVVEETPWFGEKKKAFQIAERFFNIWYLMRASRRIRRRLLWLVKFLETWFDHEELSARARMFLERDPETLGRERYAEMALAYSQTVPDKYLQRNLESASLHAVLDDGVRRLIDFSDLPPELQDKKARMEHLLQVHATMCNLNIDWTGINPPDFWRLLGGSPHFSLMEKARMVERLPALTKDELKQLYLSLEAVEQRVLNFYSENREDVNQLYRALACGEMADVYDYENAIALAHRHDIYLLPLIAIASRVNTYLYQERLSEDEINRAESALRSILREPGFEPFGWKELGDLLMNHSERYEEAEQAYRQAISLDPQLTNAWIAIGYLYGYHLHRHKEAIDICRHAAELEPRSARPWILIAFILGAHIESYQEAEEAYRIALKLEPDSSVSWRGLALLLRGQPDRYEEAEQAYRRAIALEPQSAVLWLGLGILLGNQTDRHDETEQAYRRAIELEPRSADLWNLLGAFYCKNPMRSEEAEAAYRRAIELKPTSAISWHGLGLSLSLDSGRLKEAEEAYRRAIELDPSDPDVWSCLGILLSYELERYEEAEQAYRKAIKLKPDSVDAWNDLGDLLSEHMERYEEAEQAYRKAIELEPSSADAWNNLGDLLCEHMERYEEAEQAYRKAIELELSSADAWNNLGDLLCEHMERYEEAEQAYRRAIAIDANSAYSWNNLGILFADYLQRREEAEQAFKHAIELNSDQPYQWSNLGKLLESSRRLKESAECYLHAFAIDPKREWDLDRCLRVSKRAAKLSENIVPVLAIVRRAYEVAPNNAQAQFTLAQILILAGEWQEASDLLERLAGDEAVFFDDSFFRTAMLKGYLKDVIAILIRTGASERWRPLFEALQAIRAGTPDYLNIVAPEVRTAALPILRKISPELFSETSNTEDKSKRRTRKSVRRRKSLR